MTEGTSDSSLALCWFSCIRSFNPHNCPQESILEKLRLGEVTKGYIEPEISAGGNENQCLTPKSKLFFVSSIANSL